MSPHSFRGSVRRRLLALLLIPAGIAAVGSCTDDSEWRSAPVREDEGVSSGQVQVLFALDAASATVAIDGDEHTITLDQPSDVLAFTDRPLREAQRTSVDELARRWDGFFGDDPPNAAMSGVTPDGFSVDVPVELTSFSSAADRAVFTARRIDDGGSVPVPTDLESVSLFIDDAASCGASTGEGAQEVDSDCLVFGSTFVPFDSSF